MKRGWWLLLVTFLVSLPIVSARNSSIMGLFLGTEDNSMFFLRVIYFMLIFIVLYNTARKTVFKEENENKRATMFVLAFSLIAEHVTPDLWVESFGWILTIIAPIMIVWWIMGLFFKDNENETFNWRRFWLSLLALIIFFVFAGGSSGLSLGLRGVPAIGPWLDEVLSELNYFLFYGIPPAILAILAAAILGGILFAVFRRREGGEGRRIWPYILLAIGVLILLISTAQGGMGWLSVDFLGSWWVILVILGIIALVAAALWPFFRGGGGDGLSPRILAWIIGLLLLIGVILLAVAYPYYAGLILLAALILYALYFLLRGREGGSLFSRFVAWLRANPNIARAIWYLFIILGVILLIYFLFTSGLLGGLLNLLLALPWWVWVALIILILLLLFFFLGRRGNNLYLDVQTPNGLIRHGSGRRDINLNINQAMPIVFRAYRGRTRITAGRLEGVQINLNVNNGALAPNSGATNARGELRVVYTAPGQNGNAALGVQVTHAEIDPLTTIDDYNLVYGGGAAPRDMEAEVRDNPIDIETGNAATIRIDVDDGASAGINNAQVVIDFPNDPGIPQQTAVTVGGTNARPATASFNTPVFNNAGTFDFVVTVTANGRQNANAVGAIEVNDRNIPDLEIFNIQLNPGPNPRINQRVEIEFSVREEGTPNLIDNANVAIVPANNVTQPVNIGGGRYRGYFTPDQTQRGMNNLLVQANLNGYNGDTENVQIDVQDLPQINVVITPPPSPMRAGTPEDLRVQVRDPAGNPLQANVEILQNRRQIFQNRTDDITYPFQTNNPGPYVFTINVTEPTYQDYTQTVVVQVTPMLTARIVANVTDPNNGNAPVNGPIVVGQDVDINIEVIDQNGNQVTEGQVTITPNQFLNNYAGTPALTARFDSNAAAATLNARNPRQRFTYDINFNAPGFRNVRPLSVNIDLQLSPMQVNFENNIPPQTPIRVGDSSDINLEILDLNGNPVPNGTVRFNPAIPAVPANFAGGYYNARFTPVNPGNYNFTATVESPGYAPQDIQFTIDANAQRRMRVRCNWLPEPSTSNRIMLMNFRVFDNVTGDGLENMEITIRDNHADPINIQNIGPAPITQVTNNQGVLAGDLRIDLGGRVLRRGESEGHNLTIEVRDPAGAYPATSNAATPIVLTFHPPRSRLGGPESRVF